VRDSGLLRSKQWRGSQEQKTSPVDLIEVHIESLSHSE
jgi:hypothetical protein